MSSRKYVTVISLLKCSNIFDVIIVFGYYYGSKLAMVDTSVIQRIFKFTM